MSDALLQSAVRAHQAGNLAEAARLYNAVLRADARNFQALYLLGYVYFQTGQFLRAEQLIGEALTVNPRSPDAFYNRGCALQQLQRHPEALICFDSALALKPDYEDALVNRGVALMGLGRLADAVDSFDRALKISATDHEALANRSAALFALKRYTESARDSEALLKMVPGHPYTFGTLVLGRAFACDWRNFAADRERLAADLRAGRRTMPPHGTTLVCDDPVLQLAAARIWVADRSAPAAAALYRGEQYVHPKIRVAYLSADFHAHATAFLAAGLFEQHDRAAFETVGISFGPDDGSAMRARLARAFDRFLDVRGKSDAEVAQAMRAMEIDIAVDLKGFTDNARPGILAHRPAPVQVNYLGYPGTMGAPYIDYILADRVVIPEADAARYSEAVAYLPDCYQATDNTRAVPQCALTRAEAGLPEAGFVFCAFNNTYKITPPVFEIWMRLLKAIDQSVLWLFEDNQTAAQNLRCEARSRGVDPLRLVFAPRVSYADHVARHRLADLFLDTLPCSAHTTASDALWAGLPLLTCRGTTFAGLVAASALHAVGMPELIANALEEYEALALALARDPGRIAALKIKLDGVRNAAPLFDTARVTRNIEAAYREMHERHRRGEKPASFAVAPL